MARPTIGDDARVAISLRVDPDLLAAYKAGGPGYQSRMHDALWIGAGGITSLAPEQAETKRAWLVAELQALPPAELAAVLKIVKR